MVEPTPPHVAATLPAHVQATHGCAPPGHSAFVRHDWPCVPWHEVRQLVSRPAGPMLVTQQTWLCGQFAASSQAATTPPAQTAKLG
jgi:hypothetical protein